MAYNQLDAYMDSQYGYRSWQRIEASAVGDSEKARGVVSSTFVMLIAIILPVVVIINLFVANVDIYSLLNVDWHIVTNLNAVISVSVLLVGITFIFKFIGNF